MRNFDDVGHDDPVIDIALDPTTIGRRSHFSAHHHCRFMTIVFPDSADPGQ
jgi:hypothetical protein